MPMLYMRGGEAGRRRREVVVAMELVDLELKEVVEGEVRKAGGGGGGDSGLGKEK